MFVSLLNKLTAQPTYSTVILIPQPREKDPLGQRAHHSPEWILRTAQDDGSVGLIDSKDRSPASRDMSAALFSQ